MHRTPTALILLATAGLLVLAVPSAPAAELAGVTLADSVEVGEQTLVLNGLGLRKKAVFKVYVGGLYLPARSGDAGAILAADAPRHLVMEFVRTVGAGSLTGAWDDCLKNNSPGAGVEVKMGFATLNGWMADVEDDDQITFTYLPDTGTRVTVKGHPRGTIEGKTFADALFACWIGKVPPSEELKQGLLGN